MSLRRPKKPRVKKPRKPKVHKIHVKKVRIKKPKVHKVKVRHTAHTKARKRATARHAKAGRRRTVTIRRTTV